MIPILFEHILYSLVQMHNEDPSYDHVPNFQWTNLIRIHQN